MGLNSAHANMQEINLTGQVSCAGTGAATHHFFFKAALFSNITVKSCIGFFQSRQGFISARYTIKFTGLLSELFKCFAVFIAGLLLFFF